METALQQAKDDAEGEFEDAKEEFEDILEDEEEEFEDAKEEQEEERGTKRKREVMIIIGFSSICLFVSCVFALIARIQHFHVFTRLKVKLYQKRHISVVYIKNRKNEIDSSLACKANCSPTYKHKIILRNFIAGQRSTCSSVKSQRCKMSRI